MKGYIVHNPLRRAVHCWDEARYYELCTVSDVLASTLTPTCGTRRFASYTVSALLGIRHRRLSVVIRCDVDNAGVASTHVRENLRPTVG